MVIRSRFVVLLLTLTIFVAAVTWINKNRNTSSDGFGNEGRKLNFMPTLDLSCWKQNKPSSCNTPAPTDKPTLRPSTSFKPSAAIVTSAPVVPNQYSIIKIDSWESKGYCTNGIPAPTKQSYETKDECCKEFTSGSDDGYQQCLSFKAVQLGSCNGFNQDSCEGNPFCVYQEDECKMLCEGRDKVDCEKRGECLYISQTNFCTMTEDQYELVGCTVHTSETECSRYKNCNWVQRAIKNQGQCQSFCDFTEKKCRKEFPRECKWDEEGNTKRCKFVLPEGEDIYQSVTPSFSPTMSRYCLNIRKNDVCNANLPRCKWMNEINEKNKKCRYACETVDKQSQCSKTECTWDEEFGCLPRHQDYCETLGKGRCERTNQCAWIGTGGQSSKNKRGKEGCVSRCSADDKSMCGKKSMCEWDPTTSVCRYNKDLDFQLSDFDSSSSTSERFVHKKKKHIMGS